MKTEVSLSVCLHLTGEDMVVPLDMGPPLLSISGRRGIGNGTQSSVAGEGPQAPF